MAFVIALIAAAGDRLPLPGGSRKEGHRSGRRRDGSGLPRTSLEGSAQCRASSGHRRFPAAQDHDASPEPRGLVDVHYRTGSPRARHLRLCSPRSQDDAALLVDEPDGGAAVQTPARSLRASALFGPGGNAAPGPGLLADPCGSPHSGRRHSHAHQLSAGESGRSPGRNGHARHARDPGHVYLLHRRSGRTGARRAGRAHRQGSRGEWAIHPARRRASQLPAQGSAIRDGGPGGGGRSGT